MAPGHFVQPFDGDDLYAEVSTHADRPIALGLVHGWPVVVEVDGELVAVIDDIGNTRYQWTDLNGDGFVNIDQEKMSKSLDNFFTIRDVLKSVHPEVLRLFLLSHHYRSPVDYSDDSLHDARASMDRLYGMLARIDEVLKAKLPVLLTVIHEACECRPFAAKRVLACKNARTLMELEKMAVSLGGEPLSRYCTYTVLRPSPSARVNPGVAARLQAA